MSPFVLAEHRGDESFVVTVDDLRAYLDAVDGSRGELTLAEAPLYSVKWMWSALSDAVGELLRPRRYALIVHADHAVELHRAPAVGHAIASRAEVVEVRPSRGAALCTFAIESRAVASGELISTSVSSVYVTGIEGELPRSSRPGPRRPKAPTLVDVIASGTSEEDLADDLPIRYAHASGDWNRIHVDEAAAVAAGMGGVVLQGMCTYAVALRGVAGVAGSELGPIEATGVRFTAPVRPGRTLRTTVRVGTTASGATVALFSADAGGQPVLRNGWAQLARSGA